MIHGDVEESLNLCCMEVHGQHAVDAGQHQHVGHHLRSYGHTRQVLALLTCVAEVRQDSRNTYSPGSFIRVDQQHELNLVIGGHARTLYDEQVNEADLVAI